VAAEYEGKRCGSIGDLACFSFYPSKNLGAYGDAGAVTSNDEALLAKVRKLRDHGRISKYEHDELGFGQRIDAIQAAILGAKLPHLKRGLRPDAHTLGSTMNCCRTPASKHLSNLKMFATSTIFM
jgi:dTDP-4-amino-4,6-dideoxygalactose transaminase